MHRPFADAHKREVFVSTGPAPLRTTPRRRCGTLQYGSEWRCLLCTTFTSCCGSRTGMPAGMQAGGRSSAPSCALTRCLPSVSRMVAALVAHGYALLSAFASELQLGRWPIACAAGFSTAETRMCTKGSDVQLREQTVAKHNL